MSNTPVRSVLAAGLFALAGAAWAAAPVAVSDPYARAVPPGQPNSAVFMTLTNQSDQARALVAATSPAAKTVELHTHVNDGGVMRMRRIERIDIPAGGSAQLKPGGLHVMLIGLTGDLTPGGQVALALTFDDGSEIQVQAPVRTIEAPRAAH
ncbi:copper chaperone PCu(A)C [uncultured Thiodictyon sp.]|uniref:copper chaperone PCu(A)C n=1 Tax=uncultured Thiodictyon sp. TaxID=1846217 RepID=UPI0025E8E902|nr:copper chaperone PCu(A)C [uncultured Thiodictyon sp.]